MIAFSSNYIIVFNSLLFPIQRIKNNYPHPFLFQSICYIHILIHLKCKMYYYLYCIENLGMVHSTWRPSRTIMSFRIFKNPILPVTTLCFPISESVHSLSLSSSFMPCPLIPMTILKLIHSKTMHLVCKIFTSIYVPISAVYIK